MSSAERCVLPSRQRLPYEVISCSSFSSDFKPQHVIDDKPTDIGSRWSGLKTTRETENGSTIVEEPWILLKLPGPSLLMSITIGKYHEPHPCNPTSIRILGGPTPSLSGMHELARSSLRNDSRPETLKTCTKRRMWVGGMDERRSVWDVEGSNGEGRAALGTEGKGEEERGWVKADGSREMLFAVEYIRILPGPAYEPRFNTSIWHIALHGIPPSNGVNVLHSEYQRAQTLHTNRLMLKHLRKNRLSAAYEALLSSYSDTQNAPPNILEHPLLTSLHASLVADGDFDESERLIGKIHRRGLLDQCILEMPMSYQWVDVVEDMKGDKPTRRGGHAMCLTEGDGRTYLFGGWDGEKELDDLWVRRPLDTFSRVGYDNSGIGMDTESKSSAWRRIRPGFEGALWPPPTNGHTITTDGSKLYMMGAHLPLLGRIATTVTASENGSTTSTLNAQRSEVPPPPPPPSREVEYGLVAGALMEVVEVAKKALTREGKAHMLWAYDVASGEWEVVSDGRDIPHEGKYALEIRNIFHMVDPVSGNPMIVVWGHLEDDPDAGGGMMYGFDLEKKVWVRLGSEDARLPEASICLASPDHAQLLLLRSPRKTNGNSAPTIVQWSLAHRSVVRSFEGDPMLNIEKSSKEGYRAFIDEEREELVVMFGHSKGCILPQDGKKGSIWRYSFRLRRWLPMTDRTEITKLADAAPLGDADEDSQRRLNADRTDFNAGARLCGHQLVHDQSRGTTYLVGGRTGEISPGDNEFKRLVIDRYDPLEVKRECLKVIRKQRFFEMVRNQPLQKSISYLQSAVREVFQDRTEAESKELRQMSSYMLRVGPGVGGGETDSEGDADLEHAGRFAAFQDILQFVDQRYKEPTEDLEHLTPGSR